MRRNLLLVLAIIVGLVLAYNSFQKIMSFRSTSQKVVDAQERLKKLKEENKRLKDELEYKKSDRFVEEEIRNKLGLAKPGEEVFVVPKDEDSGSSALFRSRSGLVVNGEDEKPNWQKWRDFLFEGG